MKSLIKKLLLEESNKLLLFEELSLLIEKELVIGASLKKKLDNINKPFADKLLGYLSSDKIPDKVTIDSIDYTPDDDKTLTGYFKDREGGIKARKFKIGKLLDYIGIPTSEFKGYEIEELISHLKKGTTEDFKLVDGEDILKAYHCDNYDEGETMGSCMRYEAAQSYLKIYVDNPDSVKCLVLINPNNGKVRGRALIWHMDNDQYFMDRVYVTNDAYRNLFNIYKEENNISNRANSTVTLENGGKYKKYPYMDEFEYYSPSNSELSTSDDYEDSIRLQDTGGGHVPAGVYIDYGKYKGKYVNEDNAYYISYKTSDGNREGYAHEDDIIDIDGKVYLTDDCIKTYDGEWVFRYDENETVVELTAGNYEGEYAKLDDTIELEPNHYSEGQFITTEDDYITLDDDLYDIPYAFESDTVMTYTDKVVIKDDAIILYEPHYGEYNYAHVDEATKIEVDGYGYVWILNDDLDEFEEKENERKESDKNIDLEELEQNLKDGLITQNEYDEFKKRKLNSVNETKIMKPLIKRLLREGLEETNLFETLLGEVTSNLDFSTFKMNDTLNPEIWVDENSIDPEIQKTLLNIAKDYYSELKLNIPILDITLTGSLANYNWSKYSDVDLHIIFDANELGEDKDMIKELLDIRTRAWNLKHDIKVKGFDVELYLQPEDQPHHSTGVYSLLNDEWVTEPERVDVNLDKETITKKYNSIIKSIEEIQKDMDEDKFDYVVKQLDKLKERIKKMRQSGLDSGGEFSSENIVFKLLRRNDIMKKIDDMLVKAYDKSVSLDQ